MRAFEPSDWYTDVVVVTDLPERELSKYNCSSKNRRGHRSDPARCVVQSYLPASKRKEFEEIHRYPFADSVLALAESVGDHYDWLLRTDLDTFLTAAFATWSPPRLVVGRGSYCFSGHDTCKRLHAAAKRQGLPDAGVDNIGSGWYGPAAVVRECARQAGAQMVELSRSDFSSAEKESSYWLTGIKGWPGWHYGVLSMYAGQLAINACAGAQGFDRRDDLLDFPSSSADNPRLHPHLHTWQDQQLFSKGAFAAGKYDDYNRSSLLALDPLNVVRHYALWVALVANGKVPPQPPLHSRLPPPSPPPPPSSILAALEQSADSVVSVAVDAVAAATGAHPA